MVNSNIPTLYSPISFKLFMINYIDDISTYITNSITEEKYNGSSNYWKKIQQFIFAYFFGCIVKKRLYYGETLEEVEASFSISIIRNSFTINGIDLYKVYTAFNITYV